MNYIQTYEITKLWVSKRMKVFTSIDLKAYFLTEHNLVLSGLFLGRIFQNLSSDGLIRHTDFLKTKDARNKSKYIKVWV